MITIRWRKEPILGCPVSAGKVGIALSASVNGPLEIEEAGIEDAKLSHIRPCGLFCRMNEFQ
ncbi:MAG: hypothetical protein JW986_07305 [Methanotrichaceae archaeon]|nr:hypothetical protein [Methanotrichaceae archaeon]